MTLSYTYFSIIFKFCLYMASKWCKKFKFSAYLYMPYLHNYKIIMDIR
jgi:hypothetical protein